MTREAGLLASIKESAVATSDLHQRKTPAGRRIIVPVSLPLDCRRRHGTSRHRGTFARFRFTRRSLPSSI